MSAQLEKIYNILIQHRGKGNEISSSAIAEMIGVIENDTHAKTRSLILKTAEEYNLPLLSNNRGYFIAVTSDELDTYMRNLNSRIQGIQERKRIIKENFRRFNE